MKLILTTGQAGSGFERVHAMLVDAGLADGPGAAEQVALPSGSAHWHAEAERQLAALAPDRCSARCQPWDTTVLAAWADLGPRVVFVLVYTAPEHVLAQALAQQPGPLRPDAVAGLLDTWLADTRRLLDFYHRHAARCVLVHGLAALHAPTRLVQCVAAALQCGAPAWSSAAPAAGMAPEQALAMELLRSRVQGSRAARAMLSELDSLAHLPGDEEPLAQALHALAWDAYAGLGRQIAELQRQAHDSMLQLAERARLADDLSVAATAHALHKSLLESELAHAQQAAVDAIEAARLAEFCGEEQKSRLQEMQEQLAQSEAQARRAQEGLVGCEAGITAAHGEVARLSALVSDRDAELDRALGRVDALQVENDLLVLELAASQAPAQPEPVSLVPVVAVAAGPRQDLSLDLRGEIDADNWYFAEHDGRWAGPGTSSVLRIPALADGRYDLRVDVVDAMDKKILSGTRIAVNGVGLRIRQEGRGVRASLLGRFATADFDRRGVWEIRFDFPRVVSPADSGSADLRRLAIRVRTLTLVPAP